MHASLAYQLLTITMRRNLMCFPYNRCHFSSISSENSPLLEGNGKRHHRPPRNIEIAIESPPQSETPRNFPSITQPMLHLRRDDMLYCLLALDLLHLTSCSLVDYVENLANDLQNPIMTPPNKEEMHKTRDTLLRGPTYYHIEATMIKYCGY